MTTEQETTTEKEVKRIFRLLTTTARLAEHASLTGALSGGEKRCIRQYNNALNRIAEIGAVSEGLFDPLEEGAPFGEVGVACKLLAAYLEGEFDDEDDDPQLAETFREFSNHLRNRVRNKMRNKMRTFVDRREDLKDFGELIRQAMPDFLKKDVRVEELVRQAEAKVEQMRKAGLSPDEIQKLADETQDLGDKLQRLVEKQIQVKIEQMQKDGLSPDEIQKEIQRLADEMKKRVEQ